LKLKSLSEIEMKTGNAVGFSEFMRLIMSSLPNEEIYVDGARQIDLTACPLRGQSPGR
jgi:hypothetical protein